MKIKYLDLKNKNRTVLFAMAHMNGLNAMNNSKIVDDYSFNIKQVILECIKDGAKYFLCMCRNFIEVQFCFEVIKYKKIYPNIKLIFISNKRDLDIIMEKNCFLHTVLKYKKCFDGIINIYCNLEDTDEEFYQYLFEHSSVLIGIYSNYEFLNRVFCKVAKAANVRIINLYKEKTAEKELIAKYSNILYENPPSSIEFLIQCKSYQNALLQQQELLSYISDPNNQNVKQLLSKINQLERVYEKLQQETSSYFFLNAIKKDTL